MSLLPSITPTRSTLLVYVDIDSCSRRVHNLIACCWCCSCCCRCCGKAIDVKTDVAAVVDVTSLRLLILMSLSGQTITAKPVAVTDRNFCLLQNSLLAVAVVVTDTVVATHEKERESE